MESLRKIKVVDKNPPTLNSDLIKAAMPRLAARLMGLPVELVYLFGSQGRLLQGKGGTTRYSDVDMGVLLTDNNHANNFSFICELMDIFTEILGREDIDLTILNHAPVTIRAQVVRDGYLLYQKDPLIRVDYEVKTRREYLDSEKMLQFHLQQFIRRMKGGDVGGHERKNHGPAEKA